MPHGARKKGESGYHHVVPKGIADQLLFQDDADRRCYLDLLRQAKDKAGVLVHAYCLMSNHVHLVIEDADDHLADAMKYLHERYGTYFAEKVDRTGGVFRRPYWSEPIDTNEHLLCAVRYVHANPAAAGICPASAYAWSSVRDYLGDGTGVACTGTVLGMLGGRDGFVEFSRANNSTATPFEGSRLRAHLTDDEAACIARQTLGNGGVNLSSWGRRERVAAIRTLAKRGFSVAQISRITGIGRSVCRTALE